MAQRGERRQNTESSTGSKVRPFLRHTIIRIWLTSQADGTCQSKCRKNPSSHRVPKLQPWGWLPNRLLFFLATFERTREAGGLVSDSCLTGCLLLVAAHKARKEKEQKNLLGGWADGRFQVHRPFTMTCQRLTDAGTRSCRGQGLRRVGVAEEAQFLHRIAVCIFLSLWGYSVSELRSRSQTWKLLSQGHGIYSYSLQQWWHHPICTKGNF